MSKRVLEAERAGGLEAVKPETVFRLSKVSKVYRMGESAIHALRDVDLELHPGEFIVLLGASGSGKSTLLNILGGLDRPTSGQVQYRDHDLTAARADDLTRYRREHVGFVFQFYNLIPSLTAIENVALVTEIAGDAHGSGRGARTRGDGRPSRPLPVPTIRR